jgi:hypothetical protein
MSLLFGPSASVSATSSACEPWYTPDVIVAIQERTPR